MSERPFVPDADTFFNLVNHFGARRVGRALRGLAGQRRLKIPEGVVREVRRRSDSCRGLVDRLRENFPDCVVEFKTPQLQGTLVRIERLYGEKIRVGKLEQDGLWSSPGGRKSADGQVVAVGKHLGGVVVSGDKKVGLACSLEEVECVGWAEMARRVGMTTQLRMPLD